MSQEDACFIPNENKKRGSLSMSHPRKTFPFFVVSGKPGSEKRLFGEIHAGINGDSSGSLTSVLIAR